MLHCADLFSGSLELCTMRMEAYYIQIPHLTQRNLRYRLHSRIEGAEHEGK